VDFSIFTFALGKRRCRRPVAITPLAKFKVNPGQGWNGVPVSRKVECGGTKTLLNAAMLCTLQPKEIK
jgi:hypothetical protein